MQIRFGARRGPRPLTVGLLLFIVGCDDLPDFDTLRCGNGVIEPAADEDCDGLPPGSPYRCGVPGSVAACRLICDDDEGCPVGWRCGGSGVCSAAAGRLSTPVATRLDGDSIDVADLDGDGRLDVVTNQRDALGVAYGRGDGAFDVIESVGVPLARRRPAVGDADGDGRADVAVLDADGLVVLRGTESRTLEPVAAPTGDAGPVVVTAAVRATPPYRTRDVLTLDETPEGNRFSVWGKTVEAGDIEAIVAGFGQRIMRAAQLDDADTAEEVLLAFGDHPEVYVLDMACDAQACTLALRTRLVLAGGLGAYRTGAFAADLDLDGRRDVIVQAAGARAAQVAWGSADGLEPFVSVRGLNIGGRGRMPAIQAVTDIVGDDRPDLVTTVGILAVTGEGRLPSVERVWQTMRPMVPAGVADLDADGRLDVYGIVQGALEFVLTRDDESFLRLATGVEDVVDVAHGDLDGNRYTDLVVQRSSGAVEVLFGGPDGQLAAPSAVARFSADAVWQVTRTGSREGIDAADDLLVVDGGRGYLFEGNAQRRLVTPIGVQARPQGVAIGRFGAGPSIFASGRDADQLRLDRLLPAGEVVADAPTVTALDTVDCPAAVRAEAGTLRPVDWDRDGVDELVHFDDVDLEGGVVSALMWIDVGPEQARCRAVALLTDRYLPLAFDRVDLDGDGTEELLALLSGRPGDLGPTRAVAVWAFDGEQPGAPTVVDAPVPIEHGAVLDLGDGRAAIVIADGVAWRLGRLDGELTFDALAQVPRGVLDSARGDIDGDGLPDLVLKTASTVLVLPQVRCGARDAWDGVCRRTEAW